MNQETTEPILIFISGAHGVGKTSLSLDIAKIFPASAVSASTLIKKRKKLEETKAISNITSNQGLLIEELDKYKKKYNNKYIFLDGHFCLYNNKYELIYLSCELYKEINIKLIISLHCNTNEIIKRIESRDQKQSELTLSQLQYLQDEEIKYAKIVASQLKIPIMTVDTSKNGLYIDLEKIINNISLLI